MSAENPYLAYVVQRLRGVRRGVDPLAQSAGYQTISPVGEAAHGSQGARLLMRSNERGRLLDHHLNETGLSQLMAPGDPDKDLLRLSSTNHTNPHEVTVNVNVLEEAAAPVETAPDFLLQGIVQWGTGKGFSQAVFDLRRGLQMTLTPDTVSLACRYIGAVGPSVRVSASIAYGTPQSGASSLTFTELPIELEAAALSDPFRVPAYATRVAWYSDDAPLAAPIPAATIQQRSDTNAGAASRTVVQSASGPDAFVTLANGADFVRLVNDSAAAHRYGLIYELHL